MREQKMSAKGGSASGGKNSIIPSELIENRIFLIRGRKVMFDRDLAKLYGVETGHLNRAVRRNINRFPEDFMFQLTKEELQNLICHFGISSWGGIRRMPYAFTEQGVAMLSSVLNSERAAQVNIAIMRAFMRMRELIATHKDLLEKITSMERKYDARFRGVFEAIRKLMQHPREPKHRPIGFVTDRDK